MCTTINRHAILEVSGHIRCKWNGLRADADRTSVYVIQHTGRRSESRAPVLGSR